MAHNRASALGGTISLSDCDNVSLGHQYLTNNLGGQNISLAADSADDDIEGVL